MLKKYLLLHLSFFIFSISSVFSKLASQEPLLSFKFCLFYGIVLFIMGIYAILWQQILKKIDLSIAYSNKAILTIWGIIWSALLFKEIITVKTIISTILLVIGILFINKKDGDKQ
jgi:drug/metabolite transporter (DMT)-like permease